MLRAYFLGRCLTLAEKGRGLTGVNPMVGAVLVRDGKIIAEGWHEGFGKAHAERQLLENFVQNIRSTDEMYVNLEPCCHTNKKTPPCAQMIIERGIKRVIIGMIDPNPAVAGKAIELLRKSGVEVVAPVLPAQCARLNRGFVSLMTKGRPWITLKQARGADGQIANPDGSPLRITSDEQDRWSHENLRAKHDAILVGIGTILHDNPRLTQRFVQHTAHFYRIILDQNFRTPIDSIVVSDEFKNRTVIITTPDGIDASDAKYRMLADRGIRILGLPVIDGNFDWPLLWKALTTPEAEFHGITSVLVEGGKRTWEIFRSAKMMDEEVMLVGY